MPAAILHTQTPAKTRLFWFVVGSNYLEVQLADCTLTAGEVVVRETLSGVLYQLIDHRGTDQLLSLRLKTFTDAAVRNSTE